MIMTFGLVILLGVASVGMVRAWLRQKSPRPQAVPIRVRATRWP